MLRHRSRLAWLLFSVMACVVVCGVALSEIPECLTLVNDTSNDFTIRRAGTSESSSLLKAAAQWTTRLVVRSDAKRDGKDRGAVRKEAGCAGLGLFLLHAVLRT